jgi:nucleoside-diphosphate-sugar epimerase
MRILITGGSGFFGSYFKKKIVAQDRCVSVDLEPDADKHPNLVSYQVDISDLTSLEHIFREEGPFDIIYHFAAQLAHNLKDQDFLWRSNVLGTKNLCDLSVKYSVKKIIFTSSNCLWGKPFNHLVSEDEPAAPIEIYGRSKLAAEQILLKYKDVINSVIIRCPTIVAAGRLGLLTILFEFIMENRRLWVIGGGLNRYQFIHANDLSDACIKAATPNTTTIYNIGSDNVSTFRETYEYIISKSGSKSKIVCVPRQLTLFLMKIAYFFKLSPLGPYQYKMIAEDFIFDTSKIKLELQWLPTKTNKEMMYEAFEYFKNNRAEIKNRSQVSAHKKISNMGIIRLLKFLS